MTETYDLVGLAIFLVITGAVGVGGYRLTFRLLSTLILDRVPSLRRGLAGFPTAAWGLWFVKTTWDLAQDPTSHNLLPFEMAIWFVVWMATAVAARLVLGLAGLIWRR